MAMSSYLTSYGKGREVLIILRVKKGSLSVQRMVWDGVSKEGQCLGYCVFVYLLLIYWETSDNHSQNVFLIHSVFLKLFMWLCLK